MTYTSVSVPTAHFIRPENSIIAKPCLQAKYLAIEPHFGRLLCAGGNVT